MKRLRKVSDLERQGLNNGRKTVRGRYVSTPYIIAITNMLEHPKQNLQKKTDVPKELKYVDLLSDSESGDDTHAPSIPSNLPSIGGKRNGKHHALCYAA